MSGFTGMDDLIRDLGELDARVIDEAAMPALRLTGRAAVEIARETSPVQTGRFRDSIHMGGEAGPGVRDIGKGTQTADRGEVAVGTEIFYANFVEYGSATNPARYPVGNAVETAAEKVMKDALVHYMDELARKVGF